MRIELLTVGDELLLGDTVNGNAAWLGQRLAERGVTVTRSLVVGDELDVICEALAAALDRADAVITTGGLGPTSDDLTRDALAKAAGVPLLRDAALERRLRERVAKAGRELQPMALRMAEVPEGATILRNSSGSAPGLRVELAGGVVYALPGVPFEMRTIMDEVVLPELVERAGLPAVARRTLRTATVWESVVADRLAPIEAMDGITLAYLPDAAEVKIRITAAGPDAAALLEEAEDRTRTLLGDDVYGAGEGSLAQVVQRLLLERSQTVATAESLTGGLIGAELTGAPGSSAVYVGGMVTYATEQKHTLLGVPRDLLDRHGAVHPGVAAAMAAGVRERTGADFGLAVTGVAGPDPQDGREVGTVYIGLAGPGRQPIVTGPRLPVPGTGPRVRAVIRRMTVVHALDLLRRSLLGLEPASVVDVAAEDREEPG